ncbi:type II secretion system F family protein [Candidatus Poriferisodalis sp.]|uniref:type II secretion system F family protein n=1 Tax=Candidatus Poriferisodalis sp. TaxID=3101277 RepID=UPI003B5B71EE
MTGLVFAIAGALGVWLLATKAGDVPLAPRWLPKMVRPARLASRRSSDHLLRSVLGAVAAAVAGWTGAWILFGGLVAPALVAAFGAAIPPSAASRRRLHRVASARQAWPRLLAEIRVLVANRGLSIPSALFAAGAQAPTEMRAAFSEAARTWALSTDFEASLRALKTWLADPTADAICETLLAAHQIGGVRLDTRLRALAEAAHAEAAAREDARAKQAGARFARSFVAVVPAFMAVIGLSIGRGRQAYEASDGQLLVALSVLAVVGCWLWAGRIMAVPLRKRVFGQ